jgi:hypothetical protein
LFCCKIRARTVGRLYFSTTGVRIFSEEGGFSFFLESRERFHLLL